MTTANDSYGETSTTDEVLAGRDLRGMTALVTGTSSGIGLETVRALAAHGATVIATVRDVAKAHAALDAAGVGGLPGHVTVEELDLASLASVRAGADRIAAAHDQLQLLVANAGVMACPPSRTADGFETQFGTNHLGHFVFVNRLVPLLVAGAPSRVVCLSSTGHRGADVDLDDPNFDTTEYEPWRAYGRSKTANVLFAVELDRRLRDRGVRAVAVHPGGIDTELFRHLDPLMLERIATMRDRPRKSVPQGAATSVWAGVVADADAVGGRYCEDCGVAEMNDEPRASGGVRPYAIDPERAVALWARSEELVGEHFD